MASHIHHSMPCHNQRRHSHGHTIYTGPSDITKTQASMLRHNDNNIRRVDPHLHGRHTKLSPMRLPREGTPDPPLQGRHTGPYSHQLSWGGHTRPTPLGRHTRLPHASFPGEDTPSGGGTPDPPLWWEAHETHLHQQTSQLSLFWSETHSFGANLTLSLQCLHFSLQCFHFSLHVAYFSLISYF